MSDTDWYDTHCPTCDAPEPTHTPMCAVPMRAENGDTEREALAKLVYGAIVFRGGDPEHYEATRGGICHDAADAILAKFLPEHDERVLAPIDSWLRTQEVDHSTHCDCNGETSYVSREARNVANVLAAIREASGVC